MPLPRQLFVFWFFVFCLAACAAPLPAPTPSPTVTPMPTPTATPAPRPFRVIAYVTDSAILELIPFEKLTHINFAFLLPNEDGTFQRFYNPGKTRDLVQRAHAQGVKVLISIGGWGLDPQFEALAADPQTRAVFIREAFKIVDDYGFDGLDLDWEYPDPGPSSENFLALVQEIRAARPNQLLTAAVISYGDDTGLGTPNATFPLFDFINVMTYDGPDHGTLEQFEKGLTYWLKRGVPPEKLVMGLPFYSRPGEVPYRKLVKSDPAAAQTDLFRYNGSEERYNGIPTIQKKTCLALTQASGVMFWTLEHDDSGDASLLTAIHQALANCQP